MDYPCRIWAAAELSVHSSLSPVQKSLRSLLVDELLSTLQTLSHKCNVAWRYLLYRYFLGIFLWGALPIFNSLELDTPLQLRPALWSIRVIILFHWYGGNSFRWVSSEEPLICEPDSREDTYPTATSILRQLLYILHILIIYDSYVHKTNPFSNSVISTVLNNRAAKTLEALYFLNRRKSDLIFYVFWIIDCIDRGGLIIVTWYVSIR